MKRFRGNPILKPDPHSSWEARQVFNAGAIYLKDKVHLFYRAIGHDRISRIGYATSSDGLNLDFKLKHPVFSPSGDEEAEGCEDPRLSLINDKVYMAYTAVANLTYLRFQIGLTSLDIEKLNRNEWSWGPRFYPFPRIRDKDAALLPKILNGEYMLFHRVEPDICVAYSDNLIQWWDIKSVMAPRPRSWDSIKVGIGAPPIEVSEGWLLIYHGVDYNKVYRLGVAILDKNNPEHVIYRSDKPILEPREEYEKYGAVPNVVFSCGAVLLDDQIIVYYGGADTVLCAAIYDISELIPSRFEEKYLLEAKICQT
ncbi:glycosidase [Candidatus Bathyarchaeota archaeon]|nr:glycosidase [Candidatus Bathyarchaeota archaeon]